MPGPESVQRIATILNRIAAAFAGAAVFALVIVMLYEVVSRYAFNAPTLWAFDVSFMLAGAAFILGGAITLEMNRHVSVDALAARLPQSLLRPVHILFYLAVLAVVAVLFYVSVLRLQHAVATSEVVQMSAWQPVIWPFFLSIVLGLLALLLQVVARLVALITRPGSGV